jgi:isocitrate lyase
VGKVKLVASKHQKILTNLRTSRPLGLFNTFQFANAYANGEGMKHYVNMVQEPE